MANFIVEEMPVQFQVIEKDSGMIVSIVGDVEAAKKIAHRKNQYAIMEEILDLITEEMNQFRDGLTTPRECMNKMIDELQGNYHRIEEDRD